MCQKMSVNADKITKQKDEKELFKLTDLVVGAALLGKNKENVRKAIASLIRNLKRRLTRSLTASTKPTLKSLKKRRRKPPRS